MRNTSNMIISSQDIAAYLEGNSSISDMDMLHAMIENPELCEAFEAISELDELNELEEFNELKFTGQFREI